MKRSTFILDNDATGREFTAIAFERSPRFQDESKLFKGYKDYNHWMITLGKLQKKPEVARSKRRHL